MLFKQLNFYLFSYHCFSKQSAAFADAGIQGPNCLLWNRLYLVEHEEVEFSICTFFKVPILEKIVNENTHGSEARRGFSL